MSTTIVWPLSLPQSFLIDGFSDSPTDQLIRTDMDAAISKQRSRTTFVTTKRKASMLMSKTQVASFKDFFVGTIKQGALSFLMPAIEDSSSTNEVRFVQGTYALTYVGPKWRVDMNLEVYP